MGGRGASSGVSDKGKAYGTQYHTILKSENIKFVSKNERTAESLMETMTRGRVYVIVGGDTLIEVVYFDNKNKRTKTIGLDHPHKGMKPHTHHGYYHNEQDGPKGAANLTPEEKKLVDKIQEVWYNYLNKR